MPIIFSPIALFISAILMGLSQQPISLGWFAWFGLIPLIFVLNRVNEIKHFILAGLIWGFIYYLTVIYWLANNIGTTPFIGIISMVSAVLYCTLNIILICVIIKIIKSFFNEQWYCFII